MDIKKNIAFNSILTVSSYIFPLLTYPYVARVLGVENIGVCNFVDNLINYFILFSMLGINALGVREIAKCKSNEIKLGEVYSNLFLLNLIATIIVLLALVIATLTVSQLNEHWDLMFFGAAKIIFNLFLTEWFFRGIENFKYITIRSLIVKIVFVISVFIFIKERDDYSIYYLLMCSTVIINSILNTGYRRRFVKLSLKSIHLRPYMHGFFSLGVYMVLTSFYTFFNTIYLGFAVGELEVGYYTTATKFYQIFLSLFSAITTVMLPRISSLAAEGNFNEVKRLTDKSYEVLLTFSLPIIVLATVFSPQIISILAGKGFEGAILPMRIVMPLMLIVGIEQILVIQLLVPMKKDKEVLINSIVGAILGVGLNLLLVKHFKSVGSALVWLTCETIVLLLSQIFVRKSIGLSFPFRKVLLNILYMLPIVAICVFFQWTYIEINDYVCFTIAAILSAIYYVWLSVFWQKNPLVLSLLKKTPLKRFYFIGGA